MRMQFVGGEAEAGGPRHGYAVHGIYRNESTRELVGIFIFEQSPQEDAGRAGDRLWQSGRYSVVGGLGVIRLENITVGDRWYAFHIAPRARSYLVVEGSGGQDIPASMMWSPELIELLLQATSHGDAAGKVICALVSRSCVPVAEGVSEQAVRQLQAHWAADHTLTEIVGK
ncbi:hypothetical protein [Tahibacter amnicola]|uniref:Immunity protein 26 of polymorphic toxin system n=1 Tax=Tahibacter amnicola TaxID=2976241 RepID=A0ABY6BCZ1_9GAMM|nr:hypothetical protein [Tahibacter amnicola]UXI67909.1 hypothetical protein N4264_24800 [Tahibacter amnicola]